MKIILFCIKWSWIDDNYCEDRYVAYDQLRKVITEMMAFIYQYI